MTAEGHSNKGHGHVGQLLQAAREAAGLSRSALARHAGLDTSYIYRIEVGDRRPSRESILAVSEVVGAGSEEINRWLVAASYAPLPLLSMVRSAEGEKGGRPRPGGESSTPADKEAGRRANWLEAMGLQEPTIKRLLQAFGTIGAARQRRTARTVSAAISRVTEMLEAPVRTALIPAAGGHHRLLASHVMQRLVLGAISEAAESGVSRIILILAPGMVDSLYTPLKAALELAVVPPVELHYREQPLPHGLGDAVLRAETLVGGEPFVVLLPDDVIRQRAGRASPPSELRRMTEVFRQLGDTSLVAVTPVLKSKMPKYGIAALGAKAVMPDVRPVTLLVEKPGSGHAILRSRRAFGIVGRYLMQPEIFTALRQQKKGARPRVELTDALERLRKGGGKLHAVELKARRQDVGEMLGRASELIGDSAGAGR
jgi:UTP--glucose-1-phosphate uridylyltransferase